MGRDRRRTEQEQVPQGNAMIASAMRMTEDVTRDYLKHSRAGKQWQSLAWDFYRTIGEYRYACDWVGSMLSKAVLHATFEDENGVNPADPSTTAAQYVDELFGDSDGKSQMLRDIGIHFTVAGECWIFGVEDEYTDVEWRVVTPMSVTTQRRGGKTIWYIDREEVTGDVLPMRLWIPDPEKPKEATSPSRAVLAILGEIRKLTEHVDAQLNSRLAGAGILLLPSEIQFPPAPDGEATTVTNTATGVMQRLQKAMETAISNRSSASALVPIVMTVPGEYVDKAVHLTFWSELDRQAVELRSEALRRLALGLDMPPEVLQGTADSNHWAAWQADESAIKAHTEPLLKIVTSSIAKGYLRPLLKDDGLEPDEIRHYSVGADTSAMRLRPNRSEEALELYDRGELNGAALRRETGFDKDDAMDDTEMREWFTRKVASGSTTPELVEAALRALGVALPVVTPVPDLPAEEETQEARPVPSLVDHPRRDIPDRQVSERRAQRRAEQRVDASLIAAGEQVVIRALERAGNRIKNKYQVRPHGVAAMNLYQFAPVKVGDLEALLEDAWTNVAPLAERYAVEEEWLVNHLDSYTRIVLGSQQPHTFEDFERYMVSNVLLVDAGSAL